MATFRSARSDPFTTTSTSWVTTDLPSGWQTDDYCLLSVVGDTNITIPTPPAGWTQLIYRTSSAGDAVLYVFGRKLQAGDSAPTIDWGGSNRGLVGFTTYYDVHATNPVSASTSVGTTSGTSHQITGVNVPTDGGTVVLIIGEDGASAPGTISTAYTEPSGTTSRIEAGISSGVLLGVVDTQESTPGTYSYTWGSLDTDEQALAAIVFGPTTISPIALSGVWGTAMSLGGTPDPGPGDPDDLLTWAAPNTSIGTWTVWSPGTGSSRASHSAGGNVIVDMPNTIRGAIRIVGADNVVMIGGHINVDPGSPSGDSARRGIEIQGCTGTVHIEGVVIEHENGSNLAKQGDAFYITDSPNATVQIQNCRVPMIYGQQANDSNPSGGDHGDVIQVYAGSGNGVGNLYVDKFTYMTVYQGAPMIFDGSADEVYMKRVDGGYDSALAASYTSTGGGGAALGGPPPIVTFEDYYVRSTRFTPNTSDSGGSASSGLITGGGSGYWSNSGASNGNTYYHPSVNNGTTPAITYNASVAEYVPSGTAGVGYVSPGYL